jgi:DNA-binding MarR family transcriptional regulator
MRIHHSLENAIPFLLARAGISMGQAFTKQLSAYDLTLNEWRVCASLFENEHSTLSQVAYSCSNDPSTLSRTVNRLIQKGLVKRVQSKIDRRSYLLTLTGTGRTLTEKIIPLAQKYETQALNNFKESEVDQLRKLLKKVYENMNTISQTF